MAESIKTVFEKAASNLKIDKALIERLRNYEKEFTHRNEDHIKFFGGNLLGVERVRFLPRDWENWFDNVLKIDDVELERDLHSLPTINPEHVVASDVMNLSCVWLVHAIYKSNLSQSLKEEGMVNALLIFHYKVLTSKLARDFKFPANEDFMATVYASLSKKFHIKQHGYWGALLRAKVLDVLSKSSIHLKTIEMFDNDKNILYMVTDMQTRMRQIISNHWDVINKIKESDKLIVTTAATYETDEGLSVKDLQRSIVAYKNYIHTVAGEPSNFVKDDLVKIVVAAMHTMTESFLRDSLVYISENYQLDSGDIEQMIDDVIVHAFDFLHQEYKGNLTTPDLAFIISKLRGIYMSSRSTDPALLKLRVLIDKVIMRKLKGRSAAAIAAVRVGVALYIVLRALTKKHYAA